MWSFSLRAGLTDSLAFRFFNAFTQDPALALTWPLLEISSACAQTVLALSYFVAWTDFVCSSSSSPCAHTASVSLCVLSDFSSPLVLLLLYFTSVYSFVSYGWFMYRCPPWYYLHTQLTHPKQFQDYFICQHNTWSTIGSWSTGNLSEKPNISVQACHFPALNLKDP